MQIQRLSRYWNEHPPPARHINIGGCSRQYWRLLTPMLVHPEGWHQIAFDFPALIVLGLLAERLFGCGYWLVIYFGSGLVGELARYAWQPTGAGSSVGSAGLLGALAAWLIYKNRTPGGIFGGLLLLAGGVVLVCLSNLHGPPILAGGCIGLLSLRLQNAARRMSGLANI